MLYKLSDAVYNPLTIELNPMEFSKLLFLLFFFEESFPLMFCFNLEEFLFLMVLL